MENHKGDQPSGEKTWGGVSTLFRVCLVWWPANCPRPAVGKTEIFLKAQFSPHPALKVDQRCDAHRETEALFLRSLQNYRGPTQRILPCSSSEHWLPLKWPFHCERVICQRNWSAYQQHSGIFYSQISKDTGRASSSPTRLSVRLSSPRGIRSPKVLD